MNVLKVGSLIPATAVTPSILLSEGIGKSHNPGEWPVKGAQQALPFDRDARGREVQEVVEKVNEALATFSTTSLKLTYDHERQLVIMQVVKTGERPGQEEEVIRQIPPEELLDLVETLEELQGVLFDRRV